MYERIMVIDLLLYRNLGCHTLLTKIREYYGLTSNIVHCDNLQCDELIPG